MDSLENRMSKEKDYKSFGIVMFLMKERDIMNSEKGLIHIYYGDGKGKTTAGIGLCVRASGQGKKVLVFQFLKDGMSGECTIFNEMPKVVVMEGLPEAKFTFDMTEEELKSVSEFYTNKFQELCFKAAEGDYDVIFLDEILHVIRKKLLDEALVLDFIKNKPEKLEVIMTGYDPSDAMLEMADYVTRMVKEKHPFDKGVPARAGIEY